MIDFQHQRKQSLVIVEDFAFYGYLKQYQGNHLFGCRVEHSSIPSAINEIDKKKFIYFLETYSKNQSIDSAR